MEGEDRPASCICNVSFPTRGVAKHSCYFPELRHHEVRRITLPRTPLNSASPRSRRTWQTRECNPLGASVVNEQKLARLASPTDVVGNINGKRASQKKGDLRSHECCKRNLELVEGRGPLYRARPHRGWPPRGAPCPGESLPYGSIRGAPSQGRPLRGRTYECGPSQCEACEGESLQGGPHARGPHRCEPQ